MGQLITVAELAERWAVCTATVYALVKSGALKALRVGNSIRFKPGDVDAFEHERAAAGSIRRRQPYGEG